MADFDTTKWKVVSSPAGAGDFDTSKWKEVTPKAPVQQEQGFVQRHPWLSGAAPLAILGAAGEAAKSVMGVSPEQMQQSRFGKTSAEHPYLMGAAMGAVNPAEAIPIIGEVGPLAGTAYSAAEAAGQTVASDIAQRLAGPKHPVIGTIAGLAAAGASPKLLEKGINAATGASDIAAGAKEAEAAQVQANYEKAKKLAGGAAGEYEKAGEATQAKQTQMAEQAQASKEAMAQTHQDAEAKAAKETAALEKKTASEVLPQAKKVAVEQAAGGATPPTMEQGPERIARDQAFRESITSPLQKWRDNWVQRRDAVLQPYLEQQVDDSPLRTAVAQEQTQWGGTAKPYSPRVQKLLDSVAGEGVSTGQFRFPDDTPVYGGKLGDYKDPVKRQALEESLIKSGYAPPEQAGGANTVKNLIAKQQEANAIARASKGADRTAALKVVNGIDETLASANLPSKELEGLRAEYRDHRANFPYEFEDKIQKAARPVDVAGDIFKQPQRALDLLKNGDEATKQSLGQLYAQWVGENGVGVIDKSQQPFLAKMYGKPFDNPDAWIYLDKAENHLAQVIESSPEVQAKFQASLEQSKADIKADMAKDILKDAFAQSKKLGPMGARLAAELRAMPPEQAAERALKFFNELSPQEAAGAIPAETGPTAAREAQRTFKPKDPKQAAIEAIQERQGPSTTWKRWKLRLETWGMIAGGTAAIGHPSGYAMAGLGAGGLIGAREMLVRAFQASLKDPARAEKFYKAMVQPGAKDSFKTITDAVVRSMMAEAPAIANVKADEKAKTGPAVKHLEATRAAEIAPTAGATKRAVELNKDLSKKKPVDVHQDLNRGRLSLDEVKKLTSHASKTDATAMLDHVPLNDAVDAAEVGTPEEKQMLVPMIRKKMQQEIAGGKYNRTEFAKLAQRLKNLESNGQPA